MEVKEITSSFNASNLMTVAQYATLMGKERQTIYNWIETGKIKTVEFLGKRFIDKSTLNLNAK